MSLKANLQTFLDDAATDWKDIRTLLFGSITGTLADLTTTNKTSIVAALNEVKAAATGAPPDATTATKGVVQLATLVEMATGTDPTKVATVAGVRQERAAVKAEILGGVGPAFDTLQELLTEVQGSEGDLSDLVTLVGLKANSADVYTKAEIDNILGADIGNFDAAAYYAAAKA